MAPGDNNFSVEELNPLPYNFMIFKITFSPSVINQIIVNLQKKIM